MSGNSSSSSARAPVGRAAIPAARHHLPPPLHGHVFVQHLRSALSHDVFLAESPQGRRVVRVYALDFLRRDEETRFALERACLARRCVAHPQLLLPVKPPFATRTDLFLSEEYCEGGDLYEYMNAVAVAAAATAATPKSGTSQAADDAAPIAGTGLAVELVQRLAQELLSAVHHLHTSCGIVHRNIKLESLFLDASQRLRLGGFGLCAVLPSASSAVPSDQSGQAAEDDAASLMRLCCGSKHYAAPELMQGRPYSGEAVDTWACGVVIFALLTGCFPFDATAANSSENVDSNDEDDALFRLVCGDAEGHLARHPALAAIADPQAVDLLRNMLRANPKARYTIAEALEHPFLA